MIQSIPGFWFLNHPTLAERVSEEDKKVFKYMVSLEVQDFTDEESGYSITFNFSPNPFFEGTTLTKAYFMYGRTTNISNSIIKWKDGKNITSDSAQENKDTKRSLTEYSFFNWFAVEQKKLPIDVYDGIGTIIREELWINPLYYFYNEAHEEHVNEGGNDDDDHHNVKENDDEDFSKSDYNDADKDHDGEEDDDEDFNVNDSDDDYDNDDEVTDIKENSAQDETEEKYDDKPQDVGEEIGENVAKQDAEEVDEEDDD